MSNEEEQERLEVATFAGGCFWCMEEPFEKLPGVKSVIAGYTGGQKINPTYQEVSSGKTGHLEAVQMTFDPAKITFEELLDIFWKQIDPTDAGGQFADRGEQYRTAIFYHTDEQKRLAEESKKALTDSREFEKTIVTEIIKAATFYPAESYHQDYYKHCSVEYSRYKKGSGRADYVGRHSKKPDPAQIKKTLSPLQFDVTQQCGTEPPFKNEYWDNKRQGIYVDVVSGEPLFSSLDKFESGTGWPSFAKPLEPQNIVEKTDNSLFVKRTEARSTHGDFHLGHVFTDGPQPTELRYCINSAALRFIPREDLAKEGYAEYEILFKELASKETGA